MGTLSQVPVVVMSIDLLVLEETIYNFPIGLLTINELRACPDYYRTALKISYDGDSEKLNYEYERVNGKISDNEFTSDGADESEP